MSSKALKIFALLSMTVDHLAASVIKVLISQGHDLRLLSDNMRALGRLAFPIYGFLLVEGFMHTRNLKKYLGSLLVLAVISEIPFNLGVSPGKLSYPVHQNVFLTLFLGLALMSACQWLFERFEGDMIAWDLMLLLGAAVGIIAWYMNSDYRFGGIFMVLAMYMVRKAFGSDGESMLCRGLMVFAGCLVLWLYTSSESYAFLAILPVIYYNGKRGNIRHKYFYYLYYPAHLLVFGLIAAHLLGGVRIQ